ncbi:glutathione S-transferase family protein [Eilatimonas milleporae]|uniref:Glutathione S-transferase n=1 Tax=Eilatimonas milleporae TaxID=911205 RepID=A0A3M0C3L1_9PROT|nr:glutathione S-transferase family protein [Eilatimonas milleporae]RMB01406.1 glutathione S-transferase [Eilatimonas milleporae]
MATLYHHWLSPAARFVRVLVMEKRLDVTLRLEKEWERRQAFLALNPAGEVPVLVMDDGSAYSGALAIAEYLEDTIAEPALMPENPDGRYEVRRLLGWFHTKLGTEVTRLIVSEKLFKRFLGMGEPDSDSVRCAAQNLKTHLRYIGHLASRRHYLAGPVFTMADAAAAAHISVADYFGDIAWDAWPDAKDWYMRVKSRRSIRALLADRIPGLVPPPHYGDPDF